MVPPYRGCGWHTTAQSRGQSREPAKSSGSSSKASSLPAGPARKWLSIRRALYQVRSVGAVVGELHVDAEVRLAQQLDHRLQHVAVAAGYAHEIALNGSLHLQLAVLDFLDDFARLFGGNPLLQRDLLAHAGTGRGNYRPVGEAFPRPLARHQL